MASFPSIRIEGGILGPELLDQLLAAELPGQNPADFGLDPKRSLTDEIAAAFADARALWSVFQHRLAKLPEDDLATSVTRDAWVIPFLGLLGYELRYNQRALEADGMTFAVSHGAAGRDASLRVSASSDLPPVHIVGARRELGRLPPSGRPRLAPHSLVQEYLNRTEHLWGIVTNGITLRLLRDCALLQRQAYVEFDLHAIFEEQLFQDFAAFYRLLHRSRLPRGMADAADCLLEKYHQQTLEQGGRVRDRLRDGVEECLKLLGNGFLNHPDNQALRDALSPQASESPVSRPTFPRMTSAEFYRQLLRLVYRFLFLLVSEDRGLISPNPIYRAHYGIGRLRRMLDVRAAWTNHTDLWLGLRTLFRLFRDEKLAAFLDLAPLNGELFEASAIDNCVITNRDLLEAFWHLAYYQEKPGAQPRCVNYAALDVEELGSVYESLLEFHPHIAEDLGARCGDAETRSGEKSDSLRVSASPLSASAGERALLSLKILDPACGSGHMLLAAARRIGKELARIRTGEGEPAPERVRESIRDVITHCIYGVDKNPLAIDLCRVALWLESHTAGKPLTFLDHRIRCGDSLVGVFDLDALHRGIPDKAFEPCEGDDKTAAPTAATQNREERRGAIQTLFALRDSCDTQLLTRNSRQLDGIPDDSPELIRRKKQLFESTHSDPAWLRQKQACDLWTAAFFQNLRADTETRRYGDAEKDASLRVSASSLSASSPIITTAALADHLVGRSIDPRLHSQAATLANRQPFFHWPLEFPEVFSRGERGHGSGEISAGIARYSRPSPISPIPQKGGFDVILSNPPWERIKLQEQEFFAARDSNIANAPNKAARQRLINELARTNPALHAEFVAAVHAADATSKFLRHSGRCPLTGTGDINTYAVFAETIRRLLAPNGRAGIILPTGIATDATCQDFFADLVQRGQLASLFDFENRDGLFPAVDSRMKFVLLTLRGDLPSPLFRLPRRLRLLPHPRRAVARPAPPVHALRRRPGLCHPTALLGGRG
ncbi:MAG: N-6 DNA methylase [Verrucomicrobiota bacterium]|nr:N-6 DNA methylase [Verrucomicrobiota bacterium]